MAHHKEPTSPLFRVKYILLVPWMHCDPSRDLIINRDPDFKECIPGQYEVLFGLFCLPCGVVDSVNRPFL